MSLRHPRHKSSLFLNLFIAVAAMRPSPVKILWATVWSRESNETAATQASEGEVLLFPHRKINYLLTLGSTAYAILKSGRTAVPSWGSVVSPSLWYTKLQMFEITKVTTNSAPLFFVTPLRATPNSWSEKNGMISGTSFKTARLASSTTRIVLVPQNQRKTPSSSVWWGFLRWVWAIGQKMIKIWNTEAALLGSCFFPKES